MVEPLVASDEPEEDFTAMTVKVSERTYNQGEGFRSTIPTIQIVVDVPSGRYIQQIPIKISGLGGKTTSGTPSEVEEVWIDRVSENNSFVIVARYRNSPDDLYIQRGVCADGDTYEVLDKDDVRFQANEEPSEESVLLWEFPDYDVEDEDLVEKRNSFPKYGD